MLTIELNNNVLKRVLIKYYEMFGIKATSVRFDTREYYSDKVVTDIIVETVVNVMGEDITATTIIDDELLHEIVCFALPHVDIDKVEKSYVTKYYFNDDNKEFSGIKVRAKMKNKTLMKESDLNGNKN